MAVTTIASLLSPTNNGNNNAAIKTWGAAISALFSGAGLTQTSDTGQVNWTTTTAVPNTSSGTDALVGYEVWRFTDSLQSTKPIFLRVEYHNILTGFGAHWYLAIIVGTSTNGAGTISSSVTPSFFLAATNAHGTQALVNPTSGVPAFSSGDGSYLTLVFGNSGSATSAAASGNAGGLGTFYIDRTRDSSGAITAEGYVGAVTGWNSFYKNDASSAAATAAGVFAVMQFTLNSLQVLGGVTANSGVVLPGYVPTSLSSGTTVGFSAPGVCCNGKLLPPILAALAYQSSDITAGSTVTLTVSGSSHTYFVLGTFCTCADLLAGSTSVALAVRYE